MADSDVDELESELSKKQRLINAWIAVGPEGKTTDVSDLTNSSRGYASDLRRALEGEADEAIEHDVIQNAYHPDLVEKYRSDLDDEEAIDGQWEFMDRLERRPKGEQPPSGPSPTDQPAAETTPSRTQGQPQVGGQPRAGRGGGQPQAGRRGGQPEAGRGGGQPQAGRGGGQPEAGQGGGQPQAGGRSQPRHSPPGGGQPSRAPPRDPQQQQTAGIQPGQQTTGTATAGGPAPQTGQQRTPGGQPGGPQQQMQVIQQVANQLRELDNSLTYQQQQAQTEITSAPPQSVAQSMAISKYNLIVEVRQSVQQLLTSVSVWQ